MPQPKDFEPNRRLLIVGAVSAVAASILRVPGQAQASPQRFAEPSMTLSQVSKINSSEMRLIREIGSKVIRHPEHTPAVSELGMQSGIPRAVIDIIVEAGSYVVQEHPHFPRGAWSITYHATPEMGPFLVDGYKGQLIASSFESETDFKRVILHIDANNLTPPSGESRSKLFDQTGIRFAGTEDQVGIDIKYDKDPQFYPDQQQKYPPLVSIAPKYLAVRDNRVMQYEEGTSGIQGFDPTKSSVIVLDYYGLRSVDNMELYNGSLSLLQVAAPDYCGNCA